MNYVVPIVLFSILVVMPVVMIFFIPKKNNSGTVSNKHSSDWIIYETDLELLTAELYLVKQSIDFIETQKQLIRYYNYPKRYFNYKRLLESIPLQIRTLEEKLQVYNGIQTRHYTLQDAVYLEKKLEPFKQKLKYFEDELLEIDMHYSENIAPKGWYELNEKKNLMKEKVGIIEGKLKTVYDYYNRVGV